MSEGDETNTDQLGLFNKAKSFVTIEENQTHTGYVFKDLDSKIIPYLKYIVQHLENDDNIYFCARGDSRHANQNFIDKKLIDFFVVGEKGKAHISIPEAPFRHWNTGNPIIDDLKCIIEKVNEVLIKKTNKKEGAVAGKISVDFLAELKQQPIEIQEGWKFILLAFLHNKGNDDYFKPYSGFVSLTHTSGKYNTAKEFSLSHSNDGLIYIYILNKNLNNYFKADDLTKKLNEIGMKWYEDKHNEIMVINGLYPHYILGFFEVQVDSIKRFVLNPWFYSQFKADLKSNLNYNYSNGVTVNQDNFETSIRNLGYKTYFIRDLLTNQEYYINPKCAEIKPVIEPI